MPHSRPRRGLPVNGRAAPYLGEWRASAEGDDVQVKLDDPAGKKARSTW
ncbi:MAG: hypothetical protein H6642_09270 [Caldilineaceae bacterium]|nr:hypothetical protein [Caldilineaceae bacterium]